MGMGGLNDFFPGRGSDERGCRKVGVAWNGSRGNKGFESRVNKGLGSEGE